MGARATVSWPCPHCQAPLERPFPITPLAATALPITSTDASASVRPVPCTPCSSCGGAIALHADALVGAAHGRDGALVGGAIASCPACGDRMLYQQKDFRQAIGCTVILIAAILAPWTYYVSLGVAALIDLVLYQLADNVIICYRIACHAHIRGLPAGNKVGPFDLSIHDHYRMLDRREAEGLSGPGDVGPPLDSSSHFT